MVCIFQGQSGKQFQKCYIIPGREIPKWFEKVNICDTSVVSCFKTKKVKIQLPGSGSWWGIVLCVVFLPGQLSRFTMTDRIRVNGCDGVAETWLKSASEYGKVDSHHL